MTTTLTLTLGDATIVLTSDDAPAAQIPAPVAPSKRTTPKAPKAQPAAPTSLPPKGKAPKLDGKAKLAQVRSLTGSGDLDAARKLCAEYGWDAVKTDRRLAETTKPKASKPKAAAPKAAAPKAPKAPSKPKAKAPKAPAPKAPVSQGPVELPKAAKLSTAQRKAAAAKADLADRLVDTYGASKVTAKLFTGTPRTAKSTLERLDEAELLAVWMELTTIDESPNLAAEPEDFVRKVAALVELMDTMTDMVTVGS